MLDIGLGEVALIAILALLVFGPDRLPKVAADAARLLRQVRQMAVAARRDLADAAGVAGDPELSRAVQDIRDLDPRRALRGLGDDPTPTRPSGVAGGATAPSSGAAPTSSPAGAAGTPEEAPAAPGAAPDGSPAAPPVLQPAPVDPDWT